MKHIYSSETDWFVADSPEHAIELCCKFYECGSCGLQGACGWDKKDGSPFDLVDDVLPLTIRDMDSPDGNGDYVKTTKTCREWADQEPYGLLCSTEY